MPCCLIYSIIIVLSCINEKQFGDNSPHYVRRETLLLLPAGPESGNAAAAVLFVGWAIWPDPTLDFYGIFPPWSTCCKGNGHAFLGRFHSVVVQLLP